MLGKERLVLAIHDSSFPGEREEETGRGSPYSRGARRLIDFIRSLGFTGIQFGPQGKTSLGNPSPYDGTLFSRNELSVSLHSLMSDRMWHQLIDAELLQRIVAQTPEPLDTAHYRHAWTVQQMALKAAFDAFCQRKAELKDLWKEFENWRAEQKGIADDWLLRDSIFEALAVEYGTDDWRSWNPSREHRFDKRLFNPDDGEKEACKKRIDELIENHSETVQFYAFCQFIVHRQHDSFRKYCNDAGLKLYGDLQVGYSLRDSLNWAHLFLPQYLMGAPPSRTNPDGQPWGFQVLDPRKYFNEDGSNGPALKFVHSRIEKMLHEFDGLRVDHPHGIVCPWIYRSDLANPYAAVQNGARLFCSPDLPEHPLLASLAIVRPEQINRDVSLYADNRVNDLTDEQVTQYATIMSEIIKQLDNAADAEIACEVLSTCPYPLRRVLEKYNLGRFRVTQKADLNNPGDGYRSENAAPSDWIMLGNHDTKPIWLVVDEWFEQGQAAVRAGYLAERLEPDAAKRAQRASEFAQSRHSLCAAMFADMFASPAKNVSIFFPDLIGMKEIYNRPGTIGDDNWVLRVPQDFEKKYSSNVKNGEAVWLPEVLAIALRSRQSPERERLAAALECHSRL